MNIQDLKIPAPPSNGLYKLYSIRGSLTWIDVKKENQMLSTYSKIAYIQKWNDGERTELCMHAKTTDGRAWRKIVCDRLSDDLLEKVKGHEKDTAILNMTQVLGWLQKGMAYTTRCYIEDVSEKNEKLKNWNITEWFVNALKEIEEASDYTEGEDSDEVTEVNEISEPSDTSDFSDIAEDDD